MRRLLLLPAILALVACQPSFQPPGRPAASTPSASLVRLWQDATIFDVARRLLDGAKTRLWVEMYEFDRPDLAAAMEAAKVRGVDVRLVYDPSVPQTLATALRLAGHGVAARAYPLDDRRRQIDHVKLVLADQAALVGGMNWGRNSAANHDYALEVPSGDSRLVSIFEQDWSFAAGQLPATPPPAARSVQTAPGEEIRAALTRALRRARVSVRAEVFVLTDVDVMHELAAAARRGVSVRVLLDPRQDVNRPSRLLLRQAGVEVRWFPAPKGSKLHAKAGLFDGRLLLGSANWSFGGLSVNHELDLEIEEPLTAERFRARFDADWGA